MKKLTKEIVDNHLKELQKSECQFLADLQDKAMFGSDYELGYYKNFDNNFDGLWSKLKDNG